MAAWSGAIPTDWETRQPVEIRCGRGGHSSWMPTPRCRIAVPRYASMAELRREMHPRGHGYAMALGRRAAGANRTRCAMRPDRGRHGHQIRQAAASRDVRKVRGARRDKEGVLHRSRDCRGARGSRGGLGGIPGRTRSRDTVAATPSAPNKRPPAHVESDSHAFSIAAASRRSGVWRSLRPLP